MRSQGKYLFFNKFPVACKLLIWSKNFSENLMINFHRNRISNFNYVLKKIRIKPPEPKHFLWKCKDHWLEVVFVFWKRISGSMEIILRDNFCHTFSICFLDPLGRMVQGLKAHLNLSQSMIHELISYVKHEIL